MSELKKITLDRCNLDAFYAKPKTLDKLEEISLEGNKISTLDG